MQREAADVLLMPVIRDAAVCSTPGADNVRPLKTRGTFYVNTSGTAKAKTNVLKSIFSARKEGNRKTGDILTPRRERMIYRCSSFI